jgi:NAD(P)-dependent dehydrogenase (short-subunit alcohol dehydrogenase family)
MTASRPVAVVTGAGRGLGAAIAQRLAADGHPVAVNDLPGSAGALDVVARIRAAGGIAYFQPADVTAPQDTARLISETGRELGPIGVLVLNATGPQPVAGIDDLTWPAALDQLEFFVKSPLLLVQAVLPEMRARRWGRIINIGSDIPERVLPGMSAYSAAKAAQTSFTRTLARELGPSGITVNLIAPGWIPVERHSGTAQSEFDDYLANVPLGRFGTPADIAAAVAFLARDDAGFVTGQRIAVNGGHTLP